MAKKTKITNYPSDMDQECVLLCNAINALPGIETVESCCGHELEPFMVCFLCSSLESLLHLARFVDHPWKIETFWGDSSDILLFHMEGPNGHAEADRLAKRILASIKI